MNVCVAVRKREIHCALVWMLVNIFLLEFLSMTSINRDREVREIKIKRSFREGAKCDCYCKRFLSGCLFAIFFFFLRLPQKEIVFLTRH